LTNVFRVWLQRDRDRLPAFNHSAPRFGGPFRFSKAAIEKGKATSLSNADKLH
jgi:hypothetical protein